MAEIALKDTTFTKLILGKAWVNWKKLFSSVKRDLILGALEALVGFGIFYYLRGLPVALDAILTAGAFTFGPLGLTVTLVFLWYLLISPAELAYEAVYSLLLSFSKMELPKQEKPTNWTIWKQMDDWTVEQFVSILAKTEPSISVRDPNKSAYLKIISDAIDNRDLPYIKEYDVGEFSSRVYEKKVTAYTRIKKEDAIKWADAHDGFDVSDVR